MDTKLIENNDYDMCFACGKDNDSGLHMRFDINDERCLAYFTPEPRHQSYPGRMHGGLVAVLLDEVTGNYLLCKEGKPSYTARIDIRYRQPLVIGEEVICEGSEIQSRGRMHVMKGIIRRADGTVLAESISKMMVKE